jgi:hypothetical protein
VAMTTADVRKARLFIPPSATGKVHVCERMSWPHPIIASL